jgi:hypothetical protein
MDTQTIESQLKIIQNLIAEARIDDAFSALTEFVEKLEDAEIQKHVLHLKSRHSIVKREILQGINETKRDLNEIVKSLIDLLGEAKRTAIANANLSAVAKLEELTKRGTESVNVLDEVSLLMAESRLLEMEVFHSNPVSRMAMNEEQSRQMGFHIQRFKEILSRLRKTTPV